MGCLRRLHHTTRPKTEDRVKKKRWGISLPGRMLLGNSYLDDS